MDRATRLELYTVALIVASAALAAWVYFKPQPMPPGIHVEAPPAKFVRSVEKAPVVVEHIIVYKPEAKEKLKLPEAVKADDKKHVAASVTTPNDERQHTVTTVVNSQTGEFTTYDRVEPLPWIGVTTKSEVGAYLGLKNGEPAVRIAGRQEVLQIKSVRIGAVASVDITQSDVDSFVGIGAWARW